MELIATLFPTILLASIKVYLAKSFTISPQNVTQAEGVDAIFQCQYVGATAVGWIINGTSIHMYKPPNVTVHKLDESIHELVILALPNYNGTEVWCVAAILQPVYRLEDSSKGTLTVQGAVGSVKNIIIHPSLSSISLSWEEPFSLNLIVEPDVAYCVDIYHTINGSRGEHVLSECNVFTTAFTYSSTTPDPLNRFQFVIIPRSNILGAKNGTASQPLIVSFLVDPNVCIHDVSINTTEITIPGQLHLIASFPNWTSTTIITHVQEVPNSGCLSHSPNCCVCIFITPSLCLNCTLYHFRKYSLITQCRNAAGSNSSVIFLDTHRIVTKNIIKLVDVSSLQGDPTTSCCYEKTSENVHTITGCLAVIVSKSMSKLPMYRMIKNRDDQACVNETITGLSPNDSYKISLFEVLGYPPSPVSFPAVTESFMLSSISNTHQVSMRQESIIKSSILKSVIITTATNKFIVSSTLHHDAQGIVVIYHRCIENNESIILSTVHHSVTSNQNQTITSVGVDPGCWHVAVFGLTMEYRAEEMPAEVACVRVNNESDTISHHLDSVQTFNPIFISLFAISVFVIILLTIVMIGKQIILQACKKGTPPRESDIKLNRCEAYEVVSTTTRHANRKNVT